MHRYHGVFAPHAALRPQVAALAGDVIAAAVASAAAGSAPAAGPELAAAAPAPAILAAPAASVAAENLAAAIRLQLGLTTHIRPLAEPSTPASPGARSWARLIARIYEVDPLRCRRGGSSMLLIAFITERAVIVRILDQLGELKPLATHGTGPRSA